MRVLSAGNRIEGEHLMDIWTKGCSSGGPSAGNGMGPKPPKGQPFGDYRLQWGSRRACGPPR